MYMDRDTGILYHFSAISAAAMYDDIIGTLRTSSDCEWGFRHVPHCSPLMFPTFHTLFTPIPVPKAASPLQSRQLSGQSTALSTRLSSPS
jgi:hypothetical protein